MSRIIIATLYQPLFNRTNSPKAQGGRGVPGGSRGILKWEVREGREVREEVGECGKVREDNRVLLLNFSVLMSARTIYTKYPKYTKYSKYGKNGMLKNDLKVKLRVLRVLCVLRVNGT
ncbi:hypothetical protein [Methanocella sp. MCL-LM]|uniref:hypothetical protein n=1 Tax=Methanocella sp. MCL-LM TaxID=3412035 RepID=UPI003C79140F